METARTLQGLAIVLALLAVTIALKHIGHDLDRIASAMEGPQS